MWQRDVKGLDTASMKFLSLPLPPHLLNAAIHIPHLQCSAGSTHQAPLPGSYALAIGPNEGKEGPKAFWSEPLQKGEDKELSPGQLHEHLTLQCFKCHRELWGSKEGAEPQGKPWPMLLGCLEGRSTHPAEIFVIKGFGEEQAQQLQLALAGHSSTVRVGGLGLPAQAEAEPSTGQRLQKDSGSSACPARLEAAALTAVKSNHFSSKSHLLSSYKSRCPSPQQEHLPHSKEQHIPWKHHKAKTL